MKKIILTIITFLLVQSVIIPTSSGIIKSNSKIIYVDDDNINGPWDGTISHPYRFISDGLNNSISGDTIFVFAGIYNETIEINKTTTLIGEKKNLTIIDGNYNEVIVKIKEDYVEIKNFTIRNSNGSTFSSGIRVDSSENTIQNCEIFRTKIGLHLNNSNNNLIDNCSFHTNANGLFLENSNENKIEGCYFCHNSIGLHSEGSNNTLISYSYFHTNGIACLLNESEDIQIYHTNISNNQVNLGGLFIIGCKNILVNNSIISKNGAGFHIFTSEFVFINNSNLILNSHYAVVVRPSSKNIMITNCNIMGNSRYGFYFEEKNICKIRNCNIQNNMLYGVYSAVSYIDARKNWWGSLFGPSHLELRKSDRIGNILNIIRTIPWKLKPISEIGSNWDKNEPYMEKETQKFEKRIDISGMDSDSDNAPDSWEEKWDYDPLVWDDHYHLDPDNDALNNIEECFTDEYGSSPFEKDIFLEIDWLESNNPKISNKPQDVEMQKIVDIFKEHNINLHIDIGNLGGGEEIPYKDLKKSFAKLRDIYWDHFLHNDLCNPRKGIFHYGIVCNYCPDLNYPFMSWDGFDTFAISAAWLKEYNPRYSIGRLIAGASVHHLGHSLGLTAFTYDGIDNLGVTKIFSVQWFKYHNYKSSMNYHYKYKILSYSDGSHGRGDFNDWENLDFGYFKNTVNESPLI
ncbi:MAG: right-handed parallel beta-helix repeat-containing protein [Thermoplasmatales archaeon]|nr:right-handed parallel beta-helix repeat-containing protein [Thermoplasmatales archaeon]